MKSTFPAPREQLWKLLPLHVDNDAIVKIHRNILSQKLVSHAGNVWVVERRARNLGSTFEVTFRIEMNPMDSYNWKIVASSGRVVPGSYVENTYTDDAGNTIVSTKAEFHLKGIPDFLAGWIVRRSLSQADDQDFHYLQSLPG